MCSYKWITRIKKSQNIIDSKYIDVLKKIQVKFVLTIEEKIFRRSPSLSKVGFIGKQNVLTSQLINIIYTLKEVIKRIFMQSVVYTKYSKTSTVYRK